MNDEHSNGRPKATPVMDGLMSEEELAAEIGRGVRTLARWRSIGEGPKFVRIGRQLLYRRESVHAWILGLEQDA